VVKKTPEEEYTETRRARIILRAKLNDVPLLTSLRRSWWSSSCT